MAFMTFGPLSNAPDPVRSTPKEIAWRIYRDKMIPAIAEVSMEIVRREERTSDPEVRATATRMLGIWQGVFELLYKRMGKEFPDMWDREKNPPSVRDAWRW